MLATTPAQPLARTLASPTVTSPTQDPDAEDYFQRANLTDPKGRSAVNAFIREEKTSGRWQLADEYWLMVAACNAGTGSVVHGLKGKHNASLFGGPLWTDQGINLINGQRVDSPISFPSFPWTVLSHDKITPLFPGAAHYLGFGENGTGGWHRFYQTMREANSFWGFDIGQRGVGASWATSPSSIPPENPFFYAVQSSGERSGKIWLDNEFTSGVPATIDWSDIPTNPGSFSIAQPISDGFHNLASFRALFPSELSSDSISQCKKNFLNTIGQCMDLDCDTDARSYFARTGITDRSVKRDINNYVIGLKALNDWDNLIDAVALNSTYNLNGSLTLATLKGAKSARLINGAALTSDFLDVSSGHAEFIDFSETISVGDRLSVICMTRANGMEHPALPDACIYRGMGTYNFGDSRDQACQGLSPTQIRTAFNGTGGVAGTYNSSEFCLIECSWRVTTVNLAEATSGFDMFLSIDGITYSPMLVSADAVTGIKRSMKTAENANIQFNFFASFKNPVASHEQHANLFRSTIGRTISQ